MPSAGLVGGLGPESTIDYYRRILAAWERDAPGTAPSLVIDSLDVRYTLQLIEHDHPALIEYLLASVRRLASAGAAFAAIAANTPHVVFNGLQTRSPIPLISIVEVCAREAQRLGLRRPLLLGTRFTMEAPFYPEVFARYDIAVLTPSVEERIVVHDRYVNQLLRGDFRAATRREFLDLIQRLRTAARVDGLILGGTELPLLLGGETFDGLPALDTTALHVDAIVQRLQGVTP
jgi:aspartate racemase